MKRFLLVAATGLALVAVAYPAQADTCVTAVCVPVTAPVIIPGKPAAPAPTPKAPVAPRQKPAPPMHTPAPAVPQHQTPGVATTSPKINTTKPAPVKQAPVAKTPQPSTSAPKQSRHVTTTGEKIDFSLLALILMMLVGVGVMYLMYRLGKHQAEASFNEYMLDVLRSTHRRNRKSAVGA